MKVSAEKLNKTKAQVSVELTEEEFENSLQKSYRIVVKKINVPGFRKGKVPRRILENIYGKEVLMEEALNDAVPQAYMKALEEVREDYTAVSQPEYEMVQAEAGKPIIFKASFDIKPEVILGQYKGIELEKPSAEIKDEDVDQEIARMRERYAKLVVVDEAAQEGDVLTIDFVGKVDGQPFAGGTGENYALELGSKTFIPGFEDQLAGSKPNETRDITVTFPEDYHASELAGKEAVFTVTVKEMKRKELAPLDDEFAKDVSEFETLQELRQDIENKLKETAEKRAEQELRNAAIQKVAENAEVEIPESMIQARVNGMIEDFAFRLEQQGISLESFLKATNSGFEKLVDNYRPMAETAVRIDLVLEEIAKKEVLAATDEDIQKEIEKMAAQMQQEPAKVREALEKQGRISYFDFNIMVEKATDLIIAEAKIS